MNSFSISAYEHQPMLEYYKQWLVHDLYANMSLEKLDDPTFLQKLSIIQADGIRRDIGVHAAITHNSIQGASTEVGRKIQSAADLIASSLDDGFTLMNRRMLEVNNNLDVIGHGIGEVNNTLQQGNQILTGINSGIAQTNQGIAKLNQGIGAVALGVNALNQNMAASLTTLNSNISQSTSILKYQLQQTENVLRDIFDELKTPESQREQRFHIERGMMYFNKGMKSGDCLYFKDALEEFTTATSIDHKDYFSWYYIGMIHLYSKDHLDFDKAMSAFDQYIHYADARTTRHNLFEEALMMKAECYYLKQDVHQAYQVVEHISLNNTKAALRKMKYLSASGIAEKQKQAVEVFKGLMQQNPYIVMQVLEDYDLVNNEYIIQYIRDCLESLNKDIFAIVTTMDNDLEIMKAWQTVYIECHNELSVVRSKLNANNGFQNIIDAIRMKDTLIPMSNKIKELLEYYYLLSSIFNKIEELKIYPIVYEECIDKLKSYSLMISENIDASDSDEMRNKLSVLDKNVEILIEDTKKSFTQVQQNGKWGFKGQSGLVFIPCQWKNVSKSLFDLANVQDYNNKWGVINKNGKIVIPCEWTEIGMFHEGLAKVRDNAYNCGVIDKNGQLVVSCKWKDIDLFHDGLAKVKNDKGKYGFIDKTGRLIISCRWDEADFFKEGMAKVKDYSYIHSSYRWGFIDKSGHVAIRCKWSSARQFQEGLATVQDSKGNWYKIDKSGKIVGK